MPHAITAAPASAALSGKRSGDGPGRRWGGVLAPPRAGIEPTDARAGLGRTRARWPRPSDSRWTSPCPTPCEHPLQMALQRPGRAVGRRVGRPEGRGPRGPSRGRLGWLGRCPPGLLGSSSTDVTALVVAYTTTARKGLSVGQSSQHPEYEREWRGWQFRKEVDEKSRRANPDPPLALIGRSDHRTMQHIGMGVPLRAAHQSGRLVGKKSGASTRGVPPPVLCLGKGCPASSFSPPRARSCRTRLISRRPRRLISRRP